MQRKQLEDPKDSSLLGLHVYGDLLDFYNLDVDAPLSTSGLLFQDLRLLDRALLVVYVIFILAKAGYDLECFNSKPEPQITTKYGVDDWNGLCNYYRDFFHANSMATEYWSADFVKEKSRIRVVFAESLNAEDIARLSAMCDASASNLVVVHPRTVRQLKRVFIELRGQLKEKGRGEEQMIATGELLPMFVSDETRRRSIETEWEGIREVIVSALVKTWPIIAIQKRRMLFDESKEAIRLARAKYEIGNMKDSVRDAGFACEGILRILAEIYEPKRLVGRPEFSDLVQILQPHLWLEFGEDMLNELEYIREWRNYVSHPDNRTPQECDALKVLSKAELFMNLFEKRVLVGSRQKK